jgi:hypothetical protein
MPVSYHFKDKDGVRVALDKIDEEVCQDFQIPCSATDYSIMFMVITSIGDYAVRSGAFKMDDFNEAVKKCEYDDEKRWKILKYVHGKYYYDSWR